jgi:hypothetical protein
MEQTYALLYSQESGCLDRIKTNGTYCVKYDWVVIAKEIPESELMFLSRLIEQLIEPCYNQNYPDAEYIAQYVETFRNALSEYIRERGAI